MTQASGESPLRQKINHRTQLLLDRLRHRVAHLDALPQLTILGLLCGMMAAGIIVAFRYAIDEPLLALFGSNSDDFESLPRYWHFLLPFCGALILGTLLHYTPARYRQVSVSHVLERLNNHQGRLPLANSLVQFFGAIIALLSGQSMGREGPAVHMGAAAASQLGQLLKLPNNCLRTLIGCGVASAIAASFNTPMAGVIFSMEVILMEYTIAGFIPVIMASVTGATICQLIFGTDPAFSVQPPQMNSVWELPLIALTGLVTAIFAALFIRIQLGMNKHRERPIFLRILIAGTLTGLIALAYPQILGIGYDTLDAAMHGEIALTLLIGILIGKLIATAVSGGLGIPGGIIGPILFIGAALGGCIGLLVQNLAPGGGNPSFYVLMGMSAMMAAVINAPLTALITVFELTHNPHSIFPTMLIVVVAVITTRQLFRCDGIFLAQLEANGFSLKRGPIRRALDRVGVRSVMETNFLRTPNKQSVRQLTAKLLQKPKWLVIDEPDRDKFLLSAADVSAFLDSDEAKTEEDIELLSIPGRRFRLEPIQQQASLYEAQQMLQQNKADALYVERKVSDLLSPVIGIITNSQIDNFYQM